MRVADYIIDRLADAGVGHVFTVAGGGSVFLCDAMAKSKRLTYVCCHHEQAAAMAAEGYARAGERQGAVVVTSGPGGTNAITGVAGAWTDHVPVIVLSGQSFLNQTIAGRPGLRTLGVQEINIVDIVRPITKYAVMVTDPRSIRFHVERALWEAWSGRPGPCLLDLPADIQNAQIEPDQLEGYTPPQEPDRGAALREAVREVLAGLRAAKRPLLHVGHGVRIAGAKAMMRELIETAGLPVVTARNGNDLIESDHPLFVGRPGTFANRGANFAVQTCDFYLAIGTRLCLAQTGYNSMDYARHAKIVQVDVDRPELDKGTVRLAQAVQADAGKFLREILSQAKGMAWPDWKPWAERCAARARRYPPVTDAQRNQARHLNSYALVDQLSDLLTPDDVVVTDMGFSFQVVHQAFRVKHGQRFFTNGGTAAMGWGLPAAIGAAFATGRRVVCIAGDGGLMMNVQELATLAHHKLPVKLIVLNNGGYLTMRQSMVNAFQSHMGSDEAGGLSFPHFGSLALAYRLPFWRLLDARDAAARLHHVIDGPGPAFIEVMMDPEQEQIPKSVNRREADGTIKQTSIEDAYPYLPAEELADNLKE